MSMRALGYRRWVIADGFIPAGPGSESEAKSQETASILNSGGKEAHLCLTIFYEDRAPGGPYLVTIPAQRTIQLRLNDLKNPEPIPSGRAYSAVIKSDVRVLVQHTRQDPHQGTSALVSAGALPIID